MVNKIIGDDLVKVRSIGKESKLLRILAWGDRVDVVEQTGKYYKIRMPYYRTVAGGDYEKAYGTGIISKNTTLIEPSKNKVLKVSFVDVQQGDATCIETSNGTVLLIDGGDNQLFARYLARRYDGSTKDKPMYIDAMIVTHGDADHFAGLTEIFKSENDTRLRKTKRLFILPKRIFHNGIVKGPSKENGKNVSVEKILGKTAKHGGELYITELHDNLLSIDEDKLNKYFKEWVGAISGWQKDGVNHDPILIKRLQYGFDDLFSFLKPENLEIKILGPFTENVNGKPSLRLLHEPPKTIPLALGDEGHSENDFAGRKYSASHTINGHSIVMQLRYGNVRFLLAGDLNHESEMRLKDFAEDEKIDIRSEIFKVPHHGSADFDPEFLSCVEPVVSVISSGDESARKEYIHPRATIVGALGRYSRTITPLIFMTELAAFFEKVGYVSPDRERKSKGFYGFRRTAFGIVHIRTDGKRVLVFTHSGKIEMKEAYSFLVEGNGTVKFVKVRHR